MQIQKLISLSKYYFTDIFEEALRRTMQVINGARDEIVRIICPKQPEKFLLPSERAPAGMLEFFVKHSAEVGDTFKIGTLTYASCVNRDLASNKPNIIF